MNFMAREDSATYSAVAGARDEQRTVRAPIALVGAEYSRSCRWEASELWY